MSRNPNCVHFAKNVEEADIIVAWLAEQQIEAMVPDRHAISATTFGLPAYVPGGVEICVTDEADYERAKSLLEEHDRHIQEKLERNRVGKAISVECPKCHETVLFPHSEGGKVAECPDCKEYIDVPRPPLAPKQ